MKTQPLPAIDKSPPFRERIPALDGLRAFAVIGVVIYHLQELSPGGNIGLGEIPYLGMFGVDLFYVLSGFFIGMAVMRPARWDPVSFTVHRMRRILPAYYTSMLLLLAGTLIFGQQGINPTVWLSDVAIHSVMLHNLLPWTHGSINGAYWTLGVECSFYVLMLVLAPALRGRQSFYYTVIAMAVTCYAWRGMVLSNGPGDSWLRFFFATQLPGSLDEFVAGILVAKWQLDRGRRPDRPLLPGLLALAAALWILALAHRYTQIHLGDFWTSPFAVVFLRSGFSLAFMLGLVAFIKLGSRPSFQRLIDLSGLAFIGKISFSVYLWQIPVIKGLANLTVKTPWLGTPAAFCLCSIVGITVISATSYYLVEARWHRV